MYEDLLLKSGFSSVNVKLLTIFNTLNSLNPSFMKEIFSLRKTTEAVVRRIYRKIYRKTPATFTGKHLWQSLFFNKVAGLMPATLLKKDFGTGVFL